MNNFKGVGEEDPDPLSEKLRELYREALKGKLKTRECQNCPLFSKEIIDFLIDQLVDSIHRMDKASQIMEDFIQVFKELEIREMKARMEGISSL